jgi:hypothetical protein
MVNNKYILVNMLRTTAKLVLAAKQTVRSHMLKSHFHPINNQLLKQTSLRHFSATPTAPVEENEGSAEISTEAINESLEAEKILAETNIYEDSFKNLLKDFCHHY